MYRRKRKRKTYINSSNILLFGFLSEIALQFNILWLYRMATLFIQFTLSQSIDNWNSICSIRIHLNDNLTTTKKSVNAIAFTINSTGWLHHSCTTTTKPISFENHLLMPLLLLFYMFVFNSLLFSISFWIGVALFLLSLWTAFEMWIMKLKKNQSGMNLLRYVYQSKFSWFLLVCVHRALHIHTTYHSHFIVPFFNSGA